MRNLLLAVLELVGLLLVVVGCTLMWPPLGWVAAGGAALVVAARQAT